MIFQLDRFKSPPVEIDDVFDSPAPQFFRTISFFPTDLNFLASKYCEQYYYYDYWQEIMRWEYPKK